MINIHMYTNIMMKANLKNMNNFENDGQYR